MLYSTGECHRSCGVGSVTRFPKSAGMRRSLQIPTYTRSKRSSESGQRYNSPCRHLAAIVAGFGLQSSALVAAGGICSSG